jgi:hypothetical protein
MFGDTSPAENLLTVNNCRKKFHQVTVKTSVANVLSQHSFQ